MGKITHRNQPCLRCKSSDAVQIYEEGPAHCFSCGASYDYEKEYQKKNGGSPNLTSDNYRREHWTKDKISVEDVMVLPVAGWKDRRLIKPVMERYDVRASYKTDGSIEAFYFPCPNKELTAITGYHVRDPSSKANTRAIGIVKGIYGLDLFKNGGKKIIITEGQPDMIAVATAYYTWNKMSMPVVTMGAVTHLNALLDNREVLRKFEEIILWFDNDQVGQKAVGEAAKILGYDKVKIVTTPYKDANEMLMSEGDLETASKKVTLAVSQAKAFNPSGILTKEEVWNKLIEYGNLESVPYPKEMEKLNQLTKGVRQGEITLYTSGTGSGKSSLVRQIAFSLLHDHQKKVGLTMLEESPAETIRKLSGLALGINPAEAEIAPDDLRKGFDIVYEGDRLSIVDHAGASTDSRLLDLIEFMALTGVTHIILDHLTIAISEGIEGVTGLEAQDRFMSEVLRIVKRHNIWLGLISHLRKTSTGKSFEEGEMPSMDDIRGCLGLNTEVLLADGRQVLVQDIKEGDLLLGDDGTPRTVLSLCRGRQKMYKVIMKTSKDEFICNEDHVLTLSHNNKVFDISVKEFLKKSSSFRERCKQHYSKGYELPKKELLIPPYALGVWLGDGSKSAFRIIDASNLGIAERVACTLNAKLIAPKNRNKEYCNFSTRYKGELLSKLKKLGVLNNKHIPSDYLYSCIEDRLQLLAGLIDTDGTYSSKDTCFYFYQKNKGIAENVCHLARSVGLFSTVNSRAISSKYRTNGDNIFEVTISGEISKVPTQKSNIVNRRTNALKRGIIIKELGVDNYYGFTLDKNNRFVLGNHIITHNSGSTKQISMDIIAFARNSQAENETEKNTILMRVLKCRYTGLTGNAGALHYNRKTGWLEPIEQTNYNGEFELIM